jgi:hypothetical protein
MKPTRAHSTILRFMVAHLSLSHMLRLDASAGQLGDTAHRGVLSD